MSEQNPELHPTTQETWTPGTGTDYSWSHQADPLGRYFQIEPIDGVFYIKTPKGLIVAACLTRDEATAMVETLPNQAAKRAGDN